MATEILFAPLQGYTEAEYRRAHKAAFGGVDRYFMPFVRLEHHKLLKRDMRELDLSAADDVQVVPQIIASTAEEARQVTGEIKAHGFSEVNINMGCPFPLLTRKHKGAGILPYPDRISEVLDASAASGMRISLKMRLGWADPEEYAALMPMINESPVEYVVMHPRLGVQNYKGEPDMEAFSRFYESCEKPIYYNGDILTREQIDRITARFPRLRGVMIGRGLLANPALALEYREGHEMPAAEKYSRIRRLHDDYLAACSQRIEGGDPQIVRKMQAFWEYLLPEGDRKAHKGIRKASNLNDYHRAVNMLLTLPEDM